MTSLQEQHLASTGLVARLRNGVAVKPKRWSGDTHEDTGGIVDEVKTDLLMEQAANRIGELETCILLARDKFFSDNSDSKASTEMLRILNDVAIMRLHGGAE